MDDKHFIWITPTLLIIGFIVGYVSGLHIPKNIQFSLDKDTLQVVNKSIDLQQQVTDCPVETSVMECFNVKVTDNTTRICAKGKELSVFVTHNVSIIKDEREPYGYGLFKTEDMNYWDNITLN